MVRCVDDQILLFTIFTMPEQLTAGVVGSDGGFQQAQGVTSVSNFILELRLNVCSNLF